MARDFAKLYGFGCLGLIVVLFGAGVLMQRSWSRCPAVLDARLPAPGDAGLEALLFHYECGFGRQGTANVSIVLPGHPPIYPGNLLVLTDSSGTGPILGSKAPSVELIWETPTDIRVEFQAGAQVMAQSPAARGVRATYVEK